MAFWLSAALLNIFGRGSHSSGTVPENRTWTVFSGASSDRPSSSGPRAQPPVPGARTHPVGCGPGAGAMPWPPPVPRARFQRPSTVFSARFLPMFELPSAPSGPKSARPERAAHRLGPYGNLRTPSRGCGRIAPPRSHSSQAGRSLCPPPGPPPLSRPRALGLRASPDGEEDWRRSVGS